MLIASDVWVAALIRRAEIEGAFATVARRGDARGGAVMVKAFDTSTRRARLFARATGLDGEARWIQPAASDDEAELDAYVERQVRYDPDLWLVEIEDRQGRHFLDERVEG